MKKLCFLSSLVLFSCAEYNMKDLEGLWLEQIPQGGDYVQGMNLKSDGSAESVGMSTLSYHHWTIADGALVLSGESIGNGQTIPFSDTLDIVRANRDTLVVRKGIREMVFVKTNADMADQSEVRKPSRQAYDGFVWKELNGAGLKLWVQTNDEIRLVADPSLPGIVLVRPGMSAPHPLIRVFDLPHNDINDVIAELEHSAGWDPKQTCKFREMESGRKGVRRYVMVPDGSYARKTEQQMKSEPVPVTCNGWGVGNSGQRYFEIDERNPGKALFMEIGQEAPLFDENSVVLTAASSRQNTNLSAPSADILYTLKGSLCIGHEVRSFKPEGSSEEYWIVDQTGKLNERYDKIIGGMKNGKPVNATLKVEYDGKRTDGFAADYPGVYLVREILEIKPE